MFDRRIPTRGGQLPASAMRTDGATSWAANRPAALIDLDVAYLVGTAKRTMLQGFALLANLNLAGVAGPRLGANHAAHDDIAFCCTRTF